MSEIRMMESGYKRKWQKRCDDCNSMELHYHIKGYIKCMGCGRLYARKHKFRTMVE